MRGQQQATRHEHFVGGEQLLNRRMINAEVVTMVAEGFRILAEPARLEILSHLRAGERSVGELVVATGLGQANVSKHLQVLHSSGFVGRRKKGLYVYYSLADLRVFELCDIMCVQLEADVNKRRKMLA